MRNPSPISLLDALVVDDDEVSCLVAKALLQKLGFRVDVQNSGEQALIAHFSKSYSVIFMDCHMHEMDGPSCARAIRLSCKDSQEKTPLMIAVTSDCSLEMKQRCLVAGMADVIIKPISTEKIINSLKSHFPKQNWPPF